MGKTVNRNDVAKRAGVAPSTVSNVINGTKFVSDDVKQRVLRAIAELEYEPNLLARSFKMNSTKQVTILLSTLDNFDELYRGMYEIAFPTGYSLNVIIANDNRINYYNNCYAHRSEGIINLSRFFCTEKEYNKLISHDIAVVNVAPGIENFEGGLRCVEIPKEQICLINKVKEVLSALPFKFILFIDDLSLEERDEKVTALKAGLEGSIHERSANVMIAATSNRRHIVKENFSDRENSVHARDTMEEQLSLSDRFGLTVCFSSTGKAEYLSIVKQLAADARIEIPDEELCSLAERWALVKGGRSPRRAKQFIDYVYSCLAKHIPIDI